MEVNEDSTKEITRKEDDPLQKGIIENDNPNESSTLINKITNESNKEVCNNETSNKSIKDPNTQKIEEESTNKVLIDINKTKVRDNKTKDLNIKPKKELPIEKKPFNEFIIDHLFPSIIQEFKVRGYEVADINLKNRLRPIAGDKCWVIYCEIKDICNFWLSFEKDDISSLKSISLCKSDQNPSVIESFLIDEKRITLKLIISRILQRLNGQKLIGIN